MDTRLHTRLAVTVCLVFSCARAFEGDSGVQRASAQEPVAQSELSLRITPDADAIMCCAPLAAEYTLRNRSQSSLVVATNINGAMCDLSLTVQDSSGQKSEHRFSECGTGVEQEEVTLSPGESLPRSVQIGLSRDGFVFEQPGQYVIQFTWWDPVRQIAQRSDELPLEVKPPSPAIQQAVDALAMIAVKRLGVDPAALDASDPKIRAELTHKAGKLVARLARRNKPHLIRASENEQERREQELVEDLRSYMAKYPGSPYGGYITRFLGLVDMKTFEHTVSHAQHERLQAGQAPLTLESMRQIDEYKRSVQLLSRANDLLGGGDRIAAYYLGELYAMGGEWANTDRCIRLLEEQQATKLASQLGSTIENIRQKHD